MADIRYSDIAAAIPAVTPDPGIGIAVGNGSLSVYADHDTLSIYDLSGKKVMESAEAVVSTSGIAPGTYIARAANGQSSVAGKINIK